MSDAKLERTNVKIEANNHSEILRLQVRLLLKVFVYFEGHDDDEEEQEGMLPAMKVSENFTTIILRQRSDIQDLRHAIQKLLWLKTGRARNWSSVNLCAYYFNYSQQKLC
jgi:hypothetical protein